MSTIPAYLLTETLSVEPRTGNDGYGDTFGAAVSVKAKVTDRSRTTRRDGVLTKVKEALAWVDVTTSVNPGDRVTWKGAVYTVEAVNGDKPGVKEVKLLG